MPLSLNAQNFLEVFTPSSANVLSLEQEDPSSNSSQVLDWIAEVLDVQNADLEEPPLRVRNSLRNIGTGNEILFDGLMRLLRFHLNNQGRQLARSMAKSPTTSNVPSLFEWIVNVRQKTMYFASLTALVADQIRLVTRCINAIFQTTALDPVVFASLREWYDNGLFLDQSLMSHEQLVETAKILTQIELGDELTQMVIELFKNRIKLHVQTKCSGVWNRPVLQDLSNWTHQILVPKLGDILPGRLSGFHLCSSGTSCLHVNRRAECPTSEHIHPFVKEEVTSCWREHHRHYQMLHFNHSVIFDHRSSWRLAG
ncbi:hypothetical protein KL942_002949 [Ogataea angusta]|uniref:Uncharacterized protein n=1 Tax=Pichia angusta TaxID=870730 RepID=A0ABQ7RTW6_PICAN|nr:hypothetical protein KL942_002949 [Ogataea angusta]KAG7847479.1 hypothetical protein KL940_003815 [Ogataea angusta]